MSTDPDDFVVLVVEDQEGPREALKNILGSLCSVRLADNGTNAIIVLRQEFVDLVIEDVGLPDIDGIDLLKEIKAHWPTTTVIMMTGGGTVQSAEDAMKYGAVAYLLKPFNFHDLIALIQDAKSELAG